VLIKQQLLAALASGLLPISEAREDIIGFFSQLTSSSEERQPKAAQSADVDNAFGADSAFLLWIAEAVAGSRSAAEQCLIDARSISRERSGLFADWLAQWARSATLNQAIWHAHEEISAAARRYEQSRCPHGGHVAPTLDEIRELSELPPQELVHSLDPFVRTVALMRGVSHCALQDCAIRLGTTRSAVAVACCEFDRWKHSRMNASRDAATRQ
jgi:hypothetical protein